MHLPELPRFCGGAVGFAGYAVVRYCEHLPNAPEDDRKLPDLSFAFFDRMVVFDHIRKTIVVVCHANANSDNLRLNTTERSGESTRPASRCSRGRRRSR